VIHGVPPPFAALYSALCWLLPARFRRNWADSMQRLVGERIAALGPHAGLPRRLRVLTAETLDLLRTVVREHRRGPDTYLSHPDPNRSPSLRVHMLQDLSLDLRFAVRSLARRPLFAVIVVLIIGLAAGATTAVMTLYESVVLDPVVFPEPERIVYGYGTSGQSQYVSIAPLDYLDYREQSRSFEHLAAVHSFYEDFDLTGDGDPIRLRGRGASHELFEALGVRMAKGRDFGPEDERQGPPQLIISHELWRGRFDSDPDILEHPIMIDGEPTAVIGVLPAGFRWFVPTDVWFALPFDIERMQVRRFHFLHLVGRLGEGVSLTEADAELDAVAARLGTQYPETNEGWSVTLQPIVETAGGDARPALAALLGAVFAVLLIATTNIATMLLSRSSSRSSEIAVRSALGASSGRVARLVLVESLVLAMLGALAGVAVAVALVRWVTTSFATGLPAMPTIEIDPTVLLTGVGLTLIAGIAFGLAPTLRLARGDVATALRRARGMVSGDDRARRLLIGAQIALSASLLLGAGLFLRSLWALEAQDPGFRTDGVVTARIELPSSRYPFEPGAGRQFFQSLFERLEASPVIESVGGVSMLPFRGGNDLYTTRADMAIEDEGSGSSPQFRTVAGDYFDAMNVELRAGRWFGPEEGGWPPRVAIVDEQFVRRLYPETDNVLGRRLLLQVGDPIEIEIVGVVGDVMHFGLEQGLYGWGSLYVPYSGGGLSVAMASDNAAGAIATLRSAVEDLDPLLPVSSIETTRDIVRGSADSSRFRAIVVSGFAAIALLLASLGLYGAMAYWVAERRNEVGVRLALGAAPGSIRTLVLRRGLGIVLGGLFAGAMIAWIALRAVSSLLFGIDSVDPVTALAVPAILGLAAMFACLLPALRAARTDPATALRSD
jgi:putative ABC transport system permease protein